MKLAFTFFACLFTAGLHAAEPLRIMCVGDSITQGGKKDRDVRDKFKLTLPALAAPEIALIHLGTNDQKSDDHVATIVKPLEDIVAMLRAKHPKVRVFIGHLSFNGGAALEIRPLVEEMARRLNTADSPVITVHHYRDRKENPRADGSDTFDWAHPNPQCQRKMAAAWFAAMKPYLPTAKIQSQPNP